MKFFRCHYSVMKCGAFQNITLTKICVGKPQNICDLKVFLHNKFLHIMPNLFYLAENDRYSDLI